MQQGDSLFPVPTCSFVSPWNFAMDGAGLGLTFFKLLFTKEFVSPSEMLHSDNKLKYFS